MVELFQQDSLAPSHLNMMAWLSPDELVNALNNFFLSANKEILAQDLSHLPAYLPCPDRPPVIPSHQVCDKLVKLNPSKHTHVTNTICFGVCLIALCGILVFPRTKIEQIQRRGLRIIHPHLSCRSAREVLTITLLYWTIDSAYVWIPLRKSRTIHLRNYQVKLLNRD